MNLIPVVDLRHGRVVRAVRGQRQSYQPVASRLCAGSEPVDVATALVRHCAARVLYVADLDALLGGAAQRDVLAALLQALPAVELWVDAGFVDAAAAAALLRALPAGSRSRVVPVYGSESLADRAALRACFGPAAPAAAVLSLDRRDGERLDFAGCWDAPERWPQRVIVMTLERVGSDTGPDLQTLRELQARSPHTQLIGAGGIRDAADLQRAAAAGASAWLVASALHDGRLAAVSG